MSTFENPRSPQRGENRSKSALVLEVRLAQEHPKYYEAYSRGDYKSVTAAAKELASSTKPIMDRKNNPNRKSGAAGKRNESTAAAIAAGLIKDDVNLRRAKSAIRKMTPVQRHELFEWQRENFEKLGKTVNSRKPKKAAAQSGPTPAASPILSGRRTR